MANWSLTCSLPARLVPGAYPAVKHPAFETTMVSPLFGRSKSAKAAPRLPRLATKARRASVEDQEGAEISLEEASTRRMTYRQPSEGLRGCSSESPPPGCVRQGRQQHHGRARHLPPSPPRVIREELQREQSMRCSCLIGGPGTSSLRGGSRTAGKGTPSMMSSRPWPDDCLASTIPRPARGRRRLVPISPRMIFVGVASPPASSRGARTATASLRNDKRSRLGGPWFSRRRRAPPTSGALSRCLNCRAPVHIA